MKLTGAFFCVAAFLLSGLGYLEKEKKKMRAYSGLAEALTVMKTELCAGLPPLSELIRRASDCSEDCVKKFFQTVLRGFELIGEKDFSAVWSEAAEECFPFFPQEPLRRLCLLGTVLGRSAGETQGELLESTAAFFRAEEKKMKEKMPGIRKLAIGLSACAGFLTVIALC